MAPRPADTPTPTTAPASPRTPGRRVVLAALVAGAAGLGAWQWPRRAQPPVEIGDDVCVVAPPTPYDAASGRPLQAARDIPADARCPVCGMYPARSRAWAAQVIFADGDAFFFDSPLSLMQYLADVDHYTRGRSAEAIVARYVTDMDSGTWIAAEQAAYVAGSSALGPMRAGNLPAFATAAAAHRFTQQRGGRVLAFDAIDAALLRSLAPGRRAQNHQGHA